VSLVEYAAEDAVAVLTLNRPPVNALSGELVADLEAAIADAGDPAIRAVVLTGAPHFAAGADISEFKASMDSGTGGVLAERLSAAVLALEHLAKPVFAAVRGFALGGGLELAMGCDFRYLGEGARVGQAEVKLGLIPGAGGTQRLPRLVGLARARELIYSGRQVNAEEALAIGLADRVVADAELLNATLATAQEYATGPSAALAAAKRALNQGWGLDLPAGLAVESGEFSACFGTEDAVEGVNAFLEKRSAEFKGR
jgi:enoyl-CoA hydratase/carnithine racemase